MKHIRSFLTPNPILVKELRSRMRGPRAFITLTASLVIMAGLMVGLVSLILAINNTGGNLLSPQIGQILFEGLVNFVLLLVCTVTPALTAGAISTEREKLTFEMLLATPLGSAKILWGKLISALSYVFLLIFAAVPLASLVFLFGGVAPILLAKSLFILVVVAVTLGVYGLFLSALLGRTGRATVVSFVSVMVMMVAPLGVVIATGMFGSRLILPRSLLAFSPVSMLVSAITKGNQYSGGVDGLFNLIGGQWDPSMNPQALVQFPRPIYHYSLLLYGALSIILFTLTVALVNPGRRFHLSRRTGLVGGATLLVFLGLMGGVFLKTAPQYEWVKVTSTPVVQVGVARELAVPAVPAPAIPVKPTLTPVAENPPAQGSLATPTVVTAMGAAMTVKDQVAIYTATARRVYQRDSTTNSQSPQVPVLYLVSITNDRTGDLNQPDSGPAIIDVEVQTGVTKGLSDLAEQVVWVSDLSEVPKEAQSGTVEAGGMAITFGNIQVQKDGTVQVPASFYIASLIGGGQTYRLENLNGEWQVTGTTGAGWIS